MTAMMRALRAHDLIGPPGLWVEEIPVPARPDEDAVRIDVHAAGMGFVDTLITRGKYQVRQDPPFVLKWRWPGLSPMHRTVRVYGSGSGSSGR